jgi:secondary thiamine-phosphate synthase enzyme
MPSKTFSIQTSGRIELFDITDKVESFVSEAKIKEGICFVSTPHTTACLTINERESGLLNDIKRTLSKLIPREGNYFHNRGGEGNSNAHIWSSIIKPYLIISIVNGSLKLGAWQSLFFLELDGPRTREFMVQVFG